MKGESELDRRNIAAGRLSARHRFGLTDAVRSDPRNCGTCQ
jgi:hypothetical protein